MVFNNNVVCSFVFLLSIEHIWEEGTLIERLPKFDGPVAMSVGNYNID